LLHPRPADEVEAGPTIPVRRSPLPLWSRFFRPATILPKSSDDVVWLTAGARAPRRNRCPVSALV